VDQFVSFAFEYVSNLLLNFVYIELGRATVFLIFFSVTIFDIQTDEIVPKNTVKTDVEIAFLAAKALIG
jgi:hypothetical protein